MADLEALYENFVDFILEEDEDIDESILNQYSEYEDTEIVVPDDLNFEDLEEAEETFLDELPLINFAAVASDDDDDKQEEPCSSSPQIIQTTQPAEETSSSSDAASAQVAPEDKQQQVGFQCEKCLKPYVCERYYLDHIKICSKYIQFCYFYCKIALEIPFMFVLLLCKLDIDLSLTILLYTWSKEIFFLFPAKISILQKNMNLL